MRIDIKLVGGYADVTIEINDIVCYVGMLNKRERAELINELSDAVSTLSDWPLTPGDD